MSCNSNSKELQHVSTSACVHPTCLQSSHPINASIQASPRAQEALLSPGSSLLDVSREAATSDLASSSSHSPGAAAAPGHSSVERPGSRLSPLRGSSGGLRSSLGFEQQGDSQPSSPGAGSSAAYYVYDREGSTSPGGAGYMKGSSGRLHGSQSLSRGARESPRPWHGAGEKFNREGRDDPFSGHSGVMELPQQESDWGEFIERQQHFLENKEWKVSLMRERQTTSDKPKVCHAQTA